jgi:hypothetical protein
VLPGISNLVLQILTFPLAPARPSP